MFKITVAIIGLVLCGLCYPAMDKPKQSYAELKSQEALYLPSGKALELLSFGYQNVLSDLIWFKTVQYFGRAVKSDRDFTFLSHMCDLVVRLNPRATHVYQFAGVIFAWELGNPEAGAAFLEQGIKAVPQDWQLYYMLGVIKFHFLKDDAAAEELFAKAAKLPGAPPMLARMAMRKMTKTGKAALAVQFLRDMLNQPHDEATRQSLEDSLKIAIYNRDISLIDEAIKQSTKQGSLPVRTVGELVERGILSGIPVDPFGSEYRIELLPDGAVKVYSEGYERFMQTMKDSVNKAGK